MKEGLVKGRQKNNYALNRRAARPKPVECVAAFLLGEK